MDKLSDMASSKSNETLQQELDATKKALDATKKELDELARVADVVAVTMFIFSILLLVVFSIGFFTTGARPTLMYLAMLMGMFIHMLVKNKTVLETKTDSQTCVSAIILAIVAMAGYLVMV
jgi:hypothetical protein